MKRPLTLLGFTCLFASAAASFLGMYSGAAALVCGLLAAVLLLFRRFRQTPVAAVALLLCAVQLGASYFALCRYGQWEALAGQDAESCAAVLEASSESYGRYTVPVRVTAMQTDDGWEWTDLSLCIRLSTGDRRLSAGDTLQGRVHLYLPQEGGGFSARSNAHSKGQALYAYLYTYRPYTVSPGRAPVFTRIRRALTDALDRLLPETEAALTKAVVFGEKDGLEDGLTGDFRTAGASHLLVVSGVHMSVVAGVFLGLLKRKHRRLSLPGALACAAGILCFMGVTGWTPSVVRSGVMCLTALAASLFHAEYDGLNALGLAMLVLCIQNPLAGGGVGLCLSFLSVLGILVLEPKLTAAATRLVPGTGRLARWAKSLLQGVAVSCSAVVFTLPVQVLFLGGAALLSPLTNVVFLPLAAVLLPCGLLAAVMGCVPWLAGLARLPALVCGLAAKVMAVFAAFCSRRLGWSYLPARTWMLFATVGILFLVALGILIGAKKKARIACGMMSFVVLFTAWYGWQGTAGETPRLAACGQGSVLLFCGEDACVLVFHGEDAIPVARALEENGVKSLSLFCLSSGKESLRDAAAQVLREFPTRTLLLPRGLRADEKLLLLTEDPPVPYDTDSGFRQQGDGYALLLQNGRWQVAFPGGTAQPTAAGLQVCTGAGTLEIAFSETALPTQAPLVRVGEEEILYIGCPADGQLQVRRSDGWPK